jgi:hypothetical protein
MSGSTTELNLRTAVDSDDNADYLTLDLANSLRTVDALFNNVTGHNHSSAHQGGPLLIGANQIADGSITSAKIADGAIQTADLADHSVTSIKLAPPIDIAGYFRSTSAPSLPTSSVGLELYYQAGQGGVVQTYDRTGSVYGPTLIIGSTVSLHVGGLAGLTVNADGTINTASSITLGAGTININTGIVITNDANNLVYRATASGSHLFEHTDGTYAPINCGLITATAGINVTGTVNATTLNVTTINVANGGSIDGAGSGYIRASSLTVTPGPFAAANTAINGTMTVNGAFTSASTSTNVFNGDINLTPPRVLSLGTAIVSPGTNIGKSADTVYLSAHAYVYFDLGVGHTVTCQSLVQTSDPNVKANAVLMTDDVCMTRVRGNVPVYTYQLTPPSGGDDSTAPTPTPTDIGFMATDVYAASPEFAALDDTGAAVAVNYANMAALLWGALRQLDARCVANGI